MLPPNEERIDVVNSPLGTMLLEEITPVIMVIATPLVEEACQKNKLNLVEILQPYCSFDNIDVPVRTASDQPYRLQRFKLRLVYASNVIPPNPETAAERVKGAVRNASDKLPDFQGEDEHYGSDPTVDNCESKLSWFQDFNREIVRTLSFSDHEAFDHPVACLLAVSSKDEQPVNKFVDIFDKDQLPSLLKEGAMDPKILKYYLLVHDNQEARSDKAVEILAEMRGTFGSSSCQLLCINSSLGEGDECQSKPWTNKEADASNDHEIGRFLDVNDLNEIRDLLQELSTKHIIPYMEQKIRILNGQVSTTRKGFKNQIKNLWWRKAKEEAADDPNGPKYSFSSLESQIRVLGDHAFMLRDYELALSSYRLLSTDYKIDKAWKRYAGVQLEEGLHSHPSLPLSFGGGRCRWQSLITRRLFAQRPTCSPPSSFSLCRRVLIAVKLRRLLLPHSTVPVQSVLPCEACTTITSYCHCSQPSFRSLPPSPIVGRPKAV